MLSHICSLLLFLQFANALQFDVKRSDLQISISLVQNSSSNAVDFHISMVTRFGTNGGWAALGTGHGMAGSLMFMMYTIDAKSPHLTIGTAHGHAQPVSNPELPTVSVVKSLSTVGNSMQLDFVCYGCDQWPGMDVSSDAQQFIWAKRLTHVKSEKILGIHSELGFLQVDLKQAFTDRDMHPPTGATTDKVSKSMSQYAGIIHGAVLGASFMMFYPIGVVIIHGSSFKNAFTYHWILQVSLTATCFLTIGTGVYLSPSGVKFRDYLGMHQMLGGLVCCSLILQILSGYRHHVNFLRTIRKSWWSHGHIWLGRVALTLGVVNTKLGLDYSGLQGRVVMLWWTSLGAYLTCLVYILVRKCRRKNGKGDESAYTLLNV
ncbi:hypothetical protein VTL71DRAFT_14995 [Oculimacula yallundae]|uniref:Cytochrome b561 domain-containing protein n=1 Tax=Oculimacula yallundae TaxID=86028 RepID=A0ABR4CFC3_9HELO